MLETIKQLKLSYILYNFFHKKELGHNEQLFKKCGINKRYYSPISSKDFRGKAGHVEEAVPATEHIEFEKSSAFQQLDNESQTSLKEFHETGHAILHNFLSEEEVDRVNFDIDELLRKKTLHYKWGMKIAFGFRHSQAIKDIGHNQSLKELLGLLLKGKPMLFQSLNFKSGSEQATHSDAIHMTTYPLGGLLGVWIALEDITDDNGPLHYYPGSHKLPYYLNADYDNDGNYFMIGNKSYSVYENLMRKKIDELGLEKKIFKAKKGDVLIWHANLFHGGEPHKDKDQTRKSMVLHYFKENCICYHEITQRPAVIRK